MMNSTPVRHFHLSALLSEAGFAHVRAGRGKRETFDRILPLEQASGECLVVLSSPSPDATASIQESEDGLFLVSRESFDEWDDRVERIRSALYAVDNPRLALAVLLDHIHPDEDLQVSGIHPSAVIDLEAQLHPSVSVGPFSIIGKCRINEQSRVGAHCRIFDNVEIGRSVIIRDHCSVGGTGFGFVRDESARLKRLPHVGGVVLGDGVELFPFANVDSGTLVPTRIGRGTKIDHYCHIGHNSEVGEDSVITAGTVMCGSSRVGSRAWLGVGSIIREKVVVGDDAFVGLGAVVIRNVEPGTTVAGVPARALAGR